MQYNIVGIDVESDVSPTLFYLKMIYSELSFHSKQEVLDGHDDKSIYGGWNIMIEGALEPEKLNAIRNVAMAYRDGLEQGWINAADLKLTEHKKK